MSLVSVVKRNGRDVKTAVREAVRLAGGLKGIVMNGSTVLIKPNLVSPSPSGSGEVTDCRVTEVVAKLVLEMNPARVVIGEGSGFGYDVTSPWEGRGLQTMDAFKSSGTLEVAKRLGVGVVDLNQDVSIELKVDHPLVVDSFKVAKTVVDSDVIINVPVMKTHRRTIVTIACKNMKGVLPLAEKRKTHRLGLDKAIVDLTRTVRSSFVVADGLVCNQGEVRSEDNRVKMDLIVAGRDAVSVDAVCAKIMGFDPSKIRTISLACEEGLGIGDLEKIKIRGVSIESVMCKFRDPQSVIVETYPDLTLLDEQACTACEGELQSPLFYIRQAGLADQLKGLTVVMGKQAVTPEVNGKVLFMGKCVWEYRNKGPFVDGCPPHGGWALTEKICEICGIDKKPVIKAIERVHRRLDEIS
ncbi:MAG: DUF362 domain-containing protein [Nitrososphaeria archaeon]|jgi:uncharacterized protein (DUF362 family)